MSECTDKRLGEMLHAYELGILSDTDADRVEVHLLECEHCNRLARGLVEAAQALRTDLEFQAIAAEEGTDSKQPGEKPARIRRIPIYRITAVAAAVVLFLILRPWRFQFESTHEAVAYEPALAVLYFNNLAQPAAEGRTGEIVTDLLITDLSESRYLSVISSQRLYDVLKILGREGEKTVTPEVATEVASKARARWYLTGSVVALEPAVVLSSQLVEAETGRVLAAQKVTGVEGGSLFAAVDTLTVAVKRDLGLPEGAYAEEDPPVSTISTSSPEAYVHYVAGLDNYFKYFNREAADEFEMALELDGTFAMAYYRLYMTGYGGKRAIEKAVKYADRANDIQKRYIRAAQFRQQDLYDSALSEYAAICSLYVDEKEAHYLQGQILSDRRQRPDAIGEFLRAIAIDPNFKSAYNELAEDYADENDLDSAIWAISRYIELAPDEPMPYATRGDLYAAGGDPQRGIRELERSLELKPEFIYSVRRLAGLYTLTERYADAEHMFKIWIGSEDTSVAGFGRFLCAIVPKHRGKFQVALASYQDACEWNLLHGGSRYAAAWSLLFASAIHYYHLNQPDSALATAAQAAKIMSAFDQNDNAVQNMKGAIALVNAASGRFAVADSILAELQEFEMRAPLPQAERYAFFRGVIEQARGDYDSALYYLDRAVTITPRFPERLSLGQCQLEAGLTNEAIKTIEFALASYDWLRADWSDLSVTAHYDLGKAYEQAGRVEEATARYRIFLDLWKDADPGLSSVEDARSRLTRLGRM